MRLARVLGPAGAAVFLAALDGSALFLALPAIATEFHARLRDLAGLGSVISLGSLGALPMAFLADRSGRRRLLSICIAGFAAADLASAFAPSLGILAALRVVAAAFEAVTGQVAVVFAIEESEPRHRALAVAAMSLAAGLGVGAVTILYPLLAPHWRLLYLAGGAGLAVAPLAWRILPESAPWLAASAEAPVAAFRLLLRPPWRRRLAITAISGVLGSLLYQPAGMFVALYASRNLSMTPGLISTVVIVSGLAGGAGYLFGGWISDRSGRRIPGTALAAATAVAGAGAFIGGRTPFWAGNVVGSAFGSSTGPVLGAWFGELFPTRARVTAQAANGVAGALGGIAGLQVVALLEPTFGLGSAIAVMALPALAGALILLLLPETRGQPLPD